MSEILDDDLVSAPILKEKADFLSWVPVIVLWLCAVITWMKGWLLHPQYLLAVVMLLVCTVLYITNFKLAKKLILIPMILGSFRMVKFFPTSFFFTFSFSTFNVIIDGMITAITLSHLFIHQKDLLPFIGEIVRPTKTEFEREVESKKQVEFFKTKLKSKSEFQLKEILSERNLVPKALIAAQQLLEEMENKQ